VNKKVLVVEDNPDVRETLSTVLEIEGFEVSRASNGQEALQRLKNEPLPRVILTDIMMPVMDGWSFLAQAAMDPVLASIPVIVLSAAENKRAPERVKILAFLPKPMNIDTIIDLIERCPKSA
jgi:CheY-like chemotaxis protein